MKTKTLLTSVAKILFVFAPVLIANTVFSSCSKNDDNPKLQQNEYPSLPDPKPQTVTINDAERPILAAFYEDKGNGKYKFNIYLSAERTEIRTDCNTPHHRQTNRPNHKGTKSCRQRIVLEDRIL